LDAAPHTRCVVKSFLSRLSRRLLTDQGPGTYAALFAIGCVPMAAAVLLGIWDDRPIPSDAWLLAYCDLRPDQGIGVGFGVRYNWQLLAIIMPLSLWLVRYVFRMTYAADERSPLNFPEYRPLRERILPGADDHLSLLLALGAALALNVIAQYDVALRHALPGESCPANRPDWGWYAYLFADVQRWEIVLFTIYTTLEQTIVGFVLFLALIHVVKFNFGYMRAFYLRGISDREGGYRLDFDDPDRRFGLRRLSPIFDLQLMTCFVFGLILLVTRYANTDLSVTRELVAAGACLYLDLDSACESVGALDWSAVGRIFPDFAQRFIVVAWLGLLLCVLWVANVKLLPLARMRETDGRVAYLELLLPPDSPYAASLESGDASEVEAVARHFRQQEFWPTGDRRAADTLALCIFVFLLMVLPITPFSLEEVLALGMFAVTSVLLARSYLQIQKHRLIRVDESLVRDATR
jgi:hypothetical protein